MFLIGLTGGAATGKSTASSYFRNLGVPVIDADEVARKIVEPGEPAFLEIKATFGQDVVDAATGNIVSFYFVKKRIFKKVYTKKKILKDSSILCGQNLVANVLNHL